MRFRWNPLEKTRPFVRLHPQTSQLDGSQKFESTRVFGQPERTSRPISSSQIDPTHRRNRASSQRWMISDPVHQGLHPIRSPPSYLDTNGAKAAVGVRRAQHGQPRRQSITTRRGYPRGETSGVRKHPLQQQRARKISPIAIAGPNGVRKPHELATRTTRSHHPITMVELVPCILHGSMMLASASRSSRPTLCHRDELDDIEVICRSPCQQTAQARGEACTDDYRAVRRLGLGTQIEQRGDVTRMIADRHDVAPTPHNRSGKRCVGTPWSSENHDIGLLAKCRSRLTIPEISMLECSKHSSLIDVEEVESFWMAAGELSSSVNASGPESDHGQSHQRRSSSVTSRQPPLRGGVPPVPRKRKKVATMPAIEIAATTLRTRVIIGSP